MSLITAVMPTTEARRYFWSDAVRFFLDQTYTDVELLILNETEDKRPAFCVPRVRYIPIPPQGLTTGAKRNLINAIVDSELIIHWDDDDWYHPERIATQLAFFRESGKPVAGYQDILYFRNTDRTFWCYYYPGHPPYATGTSMLYRRDWWEQHRFGHTAVGEDSEFSRAAATVGALASRHLSQMIVARCHADNTFKITFGRSPFMPATREMFPKEFVQEVGL